jgi:glycosyltransferase involved in cell wall biosynthesis
VIVTEQQVDAALRLDTDMAARVRRSYRDALAVVFVSKGNLGTMDEVVGLDGVRTVLAPNGVDVEAIRRRVAAVPARRRSRRPIRALALARYAPEKGLDILVRATALLPSDVLEVADCHGEGPERDRLVGLAAALGVSERVAFLPWCSDVPERLTGHDVLVLPSRSEGMPYAVLEAMAAGTPVVATDVHGTAEALDGGRCGLLVRQDDPEALAAALVDVHRDPDAAARRAAAAVDRVSRHDERRQLTTIVSLWDDVDSDGRDERGEGLRDRHRRVPG